MTDFSRSDDKYRQPDSPADGPETTMQFISACKPPLPDGDYRVSVEQDVKNLGNGEPDQTFGTELTFTVAGPRFSLDPADVYATYPPSSQRIAFQGQLPNVVFTRKTIPWERLIGEKVSPAEAIPWLALLVLHSAEPGGSPLETFTGGSPVDPFKIQTGTVADLLTDLPPHTRGPRRSDGSPLALDAHESTSDACRYIDLPAGLFTDIAPQLNELCFLAHARIVATDDKPEQDAGDGELSVLVANRLPHESAKNTALVVSLEGFEDVLPPASPGVGEDYVRLAVLYAWEFFMGGEDPFDALFVPSNAGLLSILSPHIAGSPSVTVNPPGASTPDTSPDSFADDTVAYALASGYAALDHQLRDGSRTFSWYRGPLIPNSEFGFGEKEGAYSELGFTDQALCYDPKSGLFDTTYAAAWQLGRLLTLQNAAFGSALRAYLAKALQVSHQTMARASVRRRFAPLASEGLDSEAEWPTALIGGLARYATGLGAPPSTAAPSEQARTAAEAIRQAAGRRKVRSPVADFLSDPLHLQSVLDATSKPEPHVVEWLAELTLLYGVPFEYLIPDEAMLPMESIRFFYVDENWVERLLDGALSTASPNPGTTSFQTILFDLLTQVYVKPATADAVPQVRVAKTSGVPPAGSPVDIHVTWPLAGFLVRSQIVGNFRGIEVVAQGPSGRLPPLRFDRIGQNVLLAIYHAPIDTLTFKHPPESFHFGIDGFEEPSPTLTQKLRSLKDGLILPGSPTATVELRGGGTVSNPGLGVLDIEATAVTGPNSIEQALVQAGELATPGALTVADFAVQMVESPEEVIFRFRYPSHS